MCEHLSHLQPRPTNQPTINQPTDEEQVRTLENQINKHEQLFFYKTNNKTELHNLDEHKKSPQIDIV